MRYCFGADVGGTSVKLGLFQEDGVLLKKWEIKTRTENEGEAIIPDIAASLEKVVKEKGLKHEDFIGIGAGIPAPVTEEGIVNGSANLGWNYKNAKKEMEELTGLHAKLGNDANVAALGEMWKGAGAGFRNMIMVTLGTGVGGGIIVDGKVVAGTHGAGGEIGHLCVNYREMATCGCGNRGCLEQYASATGIVRMAKKKIRAKKLPTELTAQKLSAKKVIDSAKEGDVLACEVLKDFGKYLGQALANLAVITDPGAIVIGGGVSRAGEMLLDYIKAPYESRAFFANRDVKFLLASLGNDAGIYGAAKMILDE